MKAEINNKTKTPLNTQRVTNGHNPEALSLYAKDDHKRVARTVGYVLTLGTQDAWWGLVPIIRARLTKAERVSLAFMSLKSLDRGDAVLTVETALGGTGQPIAPLFRFMDEASHWADMAEPGELDAYCLACFKSMARDRQAAFLDHVQGRAAA